MAKFSFFIYNIDEINKKVKQMQKQPQTIEEKKEKALKYAYRILQMRMKTYFEIKQKLKQRKTEPEIIEFVIKKLEEQEFLNDEKFAEAWIKDRLYFHPCGRLLINKKLREKGIDEKIIKKTLNKFLPPEKEKRIATEILEQKKRKMKSDLPKEKIFQKLNMFLSGKGFPGNIIFDVLNQ